MNNKRIISDILTTVCGILVGCFFTVHIYRLIQQKRTANPIKNINMEEVVKGDLGVFNLGGLHAERDRLLDRIREIDNILNINSSHTSIIVSQKANNKVSLSINNVKQNCKFNFKVYVYQIPMSLKSIAVSEEVSSFKIHNFLINSVQCNI